MHPILFKIGPVTIYSYGLCLAVAFVVCVFLAKKEARAFGFQESLIEGFCFWLLISGLIGARILYCLLNVGFFAQNPLEIFMLHHGGLVWYGGLIGATIFALVYLRKQKVPVVKMMDFIAPYIALGQAIGRIGCFLNGCCYGRPSAVCGIYFPVHDAELIPTQLYSFGILFGIFFILRWLRAKKIQDGIVFAYYILLCAIARFFIEFLRADSKNIIFGLTVFQVISLLLVFLSVYAIIHIASRKQR
jgi:phosphatidylglycerol:prolipoprotein diacylglycerol transferase